MSTTPAVFAGSTTSRADLVNWASRKPFPYPQENEALLQAIDSYKGGSIGEMKAEADQKAAVAAAAASKANKCGWASAATMLVGFGVSFTSGHAHPTLAMVGLVGAVGGWLGTMTASNRQSAARNQQAQASSVSTSLTNWGAYIDAQAKAAPAPAQPLAATPQPAAS